MILPTEVFSSSIYSHFHFTNFDFVHIHFFFYFFFFFALFLSFFPFPFLFPFFITLFHFRFRCGILCDNENQMRIENDININIGPFSLVPLYPPFNRTFDAETIADLNLRDMKTTALNSISSTEKKPNDIFFISYFPLSPSRSCTHTQTRTDTRTHAPFNEWNHFYRNEIIIKVETCDALNKFKHPECVI